MHELVKTNPAWTSCELADVGLDILGSLEENCLQNIITNLLQPRVLLRIEVRVVCVWHVGNRLCSEYVVYQVLVSQSVLTSYVVPCQEVAVVGSLNLRTTQLLEHKISEVFHMSICSLLRVNLLEERVETEFAAVEEVLKMREHLLMEFLHALPQPKSHCFVHFFSSYRTV